MSDNSYSERASTPVESRFSDIPPFRSVHDFGKFSVEARCEANVSKTGLCKSSCGLNAPKSSPKIPIPSIPLGDIVGIWLRVSLSFRTALNAPNESPPIKRKLEFKRKTDLPSLASRFKANRHASAMAKSSGVVRQRSFSSSSPTRRFVIFSAMSIPIYSSERSKRRSILPFAESGKLGSSRMKICFGHINFGKVFEMHHRMASTRSGLIDTKPSKEVSGTQQNKTSSDFEKAHAAMALTNRSHASIARLSTSSSSMRTPFIFTCESFRPRKTNSHSSDSSSYFAKSPVRKYRASFSVINLSRVSSSALK
mmetsp:Transcript_7497/g.24790  ORF Transcript_7497/g.24790 Transcript_7497/m.24790 type:complete len:310 (-) Transcript_7497:1670-2599(-)